MRSLPLPPLPPPPPGWEKEVSSMGSVDNQPGMKDIVLLCSNSEWVTLSGPFPINQAAWDQMIAVLQAMKPGLVTDDKME